MTDTVPAQLIARLESQETLLTRALHQLEGWAAHPPAIDSADWMGIAAMLHDLLLGDLHRALREADARLVDARAATATAIGALDA